MDCGVIFGRITTSAPCGHGNAENDAETRTSGESIRHNNRLSSSGPFLTLVLGNEEGVNPFVLGGRALAFMLILVLGIQLVFASIDSPVIGSSFLHRVDLVFHEAGHILFIPFGSFMSILGGSLLQILVPLIFTAAFLIYYRNPFAASVTFW
jgi:hypothetical protein